MKKRIFVIFIFYLSDGLCARRDADEDDDGRNAEAEGQLAVEVAQIFEADKIPGILPGTFAPCSVLKRYEEFS